MDNTVCDFGGYSFGVGNVDGKGGVGTRTNHLSSHKVDYWIDGSDFVFISE